LSEIETFLEEIINNPEGFDPNKIVKGLYNNCWRVFNFLKLNTKLNHNDVINLIIKNLRQRITPNNLAANTNNEPLNQGAETQEANSDKPIKFEDNQEESDFLDRVKKLELAETLEYFQHDHQIIHIKLNEFKIKVTTNTENRSETSLTDTISGTLESFDDNYVYLNSGYKYIKIPLNDFKAALNQYWRDGGGNGKIYQASEKVRVQRKVDHILKLRNRSDISLWMFLYNFSDGLGDLLNHNKIWEFHHNPETNTYGTPVGNLFRQEVNKALDSLFKNGKLNLDYLNEIDKMEYEIVNEDQNEVLQYIKRLIFNLITFIGIDPNKKGYIMDFYPRVEETNEEQLHRYETNIINFFRKDNKKAYFGSSEPGKPISTSELDDKDLEVIIDILKILFGHEYERSINSKRYINSGFISTLLHCRSYETFGKEILSKDSQKRIKDILEKVIKLYQEHLNKLFPEEADVSEIKEG